MKRNLRMEKMSDEMFRQLSAQECLMISGGITSKVTGKVTFSETQLIDSDGGTDGEVDAEIDF